MGSLRWGSSIHLLSDSASGHNSGLLDASSSFVSQGFPVMKKPLGCCLLLIFLLALAPAALRAQDAETEIVPGAPAERTEDASIEKSGEEPAVGVEGEPAADAPPAEASIEAAVVKINVTSRSPNYFQPWTKAGPSKSSAAGSSWEIAT